MSKNETEFKNRQRASTAQLYARACPICNRIVTMAKNQKYCSPQCKGKVQYVSGASSTENQYLKISGNWFKYLQKLLYFHHRNKDGLTIQNLLDILKAQDNKCALSGVPLTCIRVKGTVTKTNASIDRIVAGGPYTKDNIQLVCRAVNSWRSDLSVPEFIDWCKKVVEHNR